MDPKPVVVLGGDTKDPDQQFMWIVSAFRLADGSIVIGDQGLNKIFVLSLDAKLLRSLGRPGDGPGEFRILHSVVRLSGDSMAAWDRDGTVAVFDPGGRLVRARSDLVRRSSYSWMTAVADKALFRWVPGQDWEADGVVRRPEILVRVSVEGARTDTVGRWSAAAVAWPPYVPGAPPRARSVPFSTGSLKAGGGSPWRLAVGTGQEAYVELFDESGHRVRSVSWTPEPRAISQSAWENAAKGENRDLLEGIERPQTAPVYQALAVDSAGHVWARHYRFPQDTEDVWTVLDPAGIWLGEVSIPIGCEIHSIGREYLLCELRNAMDVESIAMLHLRR